MKKTLILLLSLILITSLIAGCGNSNNANSGNSTNNVSVSQDTEGNQQTPSKPEEMPHLVMMFPYNDVPADVKMVEDEINKILTEKVGCTVELVAVSYGNIADKQTMTLASPTEQLDLLMGNFRQGMLGFVSKGQLMPMDDLLNEYGQGILENIDSNSLACDTINGNVYGLLTNRDLARQRGFVFRKDQIDEQGITLPERVTDLSEMTPIFAKLHEAYPNMYGLASSAVKAEAYMYLNSNINPLTDNLGVLMNTDDLKVSNLFESTEYLEFCKLMTEWNRAGYIYPDILIDSSNNGSQLMRNNNLFCFIDAYKPGVVSEKSGLVGQEVEVVAIGQPLRLTEQNWSWVIPENAIYPEKAMEVLNLLFTDSDLIDLLSYGIKDYHWITDEQGFMVDGPNAAGYPDKKAWATGNAYLATVRAGDPADVWEQMKIFNESAHKSKALGFSFDSSALNAEFTALQNVLKEYRYMLEWGFADDVDATLKQMNDALYSAGLQKYMDEKQSQLDTWSASK